MSYCSALPSSQHSVQCEWMCSHPAALLNMEYWRTTEDRLSSVRGRIDQMTSLSVAFHFRSN